MARSIAETLYHWMHRRRIESEVADEMGIPAATLSAELSPTRLQAKLGADELVPLFEAIRRIGYGNELHGILHRFIRDLKGEELQDVSDEELVPQVFRLVRSTGMLAEIADGISRNANIADLEKMQVLLSTELLPIVLQMESIVMSRIQAVFRTKAIPAGKRMLSTSSANR